MTLGCFSLSSMAFAKCCNCSKHKKTEQSQQEQVMPPTTEEKDAQMTHTDHTAHPKKKCDDHAHEHKNAEDCK